MDNYEQERQIFYRLKAECNNEAKKSYEHAIKKLIRSYNTAIHENRFTVGGVVKILTYCLFRATHIKCSLNEGFICFGREKLGVHGIFIGGFGDSKLINYHGESEKKWKMATLFIVSGVGIVFGAPDMVEKKHVRKVGDGVQLSKAGLQILADNPRNVIPMNIVKKPDAKFANRSKKASDLIAGSILCEPKLKILQDTYEKIGRRSTWSWRRLFHKVFS